MIGKPLMLSPFSIRRFGAARVDTIPLLDRTLHRPAVRRMSLPMSLESSFRQLAPPAIFRPLSNLSSSCVAGNVDFQFPTGLPTIRERQEPCGL